MAKLGQLYKPKDTIIHRLNPLAKLAIFITVIITVLISSNFILNYIIALIGLILLIIAKVAKHAKIAFRLVIIVIIGTLSVHGFFSPWGETALWSYDAGFYHLHLWKEGLIFANLIISRVMALVFFGLMIVFATHPADMITELEKGGLSRKLGFIYISFIELIPEMEREADRIINAQRARGLNTQGIKNKIKSYIPLVGPLMTSSLVKASLRAMALEVRGFSIKGKKTFFREVHLEKKDKIVMGLAVLSLISYLTLNLMGFLDVNRWLEWLF